MKKKKVCIVILLVLLLAICLIIITNYSTNKLNQKQGKLLEIEAPYTNYPPVPDGFGHKEGTVETGYVIQDTVGNEFVWIPIDGTNIIQSRKDFGGDIDISQTTETMPNEIQNSINTYKGFWIGRYEANYLGISANGGVPITGVTFLEAQTACSDYSNGTQATGHLVYGQEVDMAIQFIETINTGYSTNINSGNYGNVLKESGDSTDKQNNIYDLSGNVREWTMEEKISNGAGVIRGGSYNNSLPAGYRSSDSKNTKDKYIGYRVALYIKDVPTDKIPVKATLASENLYSTSFDLKISTQNTENGIARNSDIYK